MKLIRLKKSKEGFTVRDSFERKRKKPRLFQDPDFSITW